MAVLACHVAEITEFDLKDRKYQGLERLQFSKFYFFNNILFKHFVFNYYITAQARQLWDDPFLHKPERKRRQKCRNNNEPNDAPECVRNCTRGKSAANVNQMVERR